MASNPNWAFGFIPTAAEWNGEFGLKADESEIVAWLANYAALRANTLFTLPLFLKGAATDRDGGEGIFVWNSTDTTTADNGGTVIVDASGRRWFRSYSSEGVDIRWFGAKGDGVTDCTAAIQAALNTGQTVFIPGQHFVINNPVTVSTKGQKIYGVGRTTSQIQITPNFNMGATGVLILQSGEPGAILQDFGIFYTRSNSEDLSTYPAAIVANAQPRCMFERIRITGATICVDMRDNAGGTYFYGCEFSFFKYGIWIDGCLDTVRITDCHMWPFTIAANNTQLNAMETQSFGVFSGRMDDLKILNSLFFCLYGLVTFMGTRSNPGPTGVQMTNVAFDTCGGINVAGGNASLSNCYFSPGLTTSQPVAVLGTPTGATTVMLSGCYFYLSGFSSSPGAAVVTTGNAGGQAIVSITGSQFDMTPITQDLSAIETGDFTQLSLTGNRFRINANKNQPVPIINLVGTNNCQYQITNNRIGTGPVGGVSGTALAIAGDFSSVISGNTFSGWGVNLPANYLNINVSGNAGLLTGTSQNVTGSRALGVQNTNLHAQSLLVIVSVANSSTTTAAIVNASVNGATVATATITNHWTTVTFVAPSGSHYGVSTDIGTLQLWTEQAI